MAVNVTVDEAIKRAESALGRLGLPQPWAPFLSRPHNRLEDSPNDCDLFVTWALKDNGGRSRSDYRNASIKAMRADRDWPESAHPKRGDLILLRWSNRGLPDHIGIVTATSDYADRDRVSTIEANTGPRVGTLNPAGVYRRLRFRQNIVGFIRPPYKEN